MQPNRSHATIEKTTLDTDFISFAFLPDESLSFERSMAEFKDSATIELAILSLASQSGHS